MEGFLDESHHQFRYGLLPEAFGCPDWLSRRVSSIGELEEAIAPSGSNPSARPPSR